MKQDLCFYLSNVQKEHSTFSKDLGPFLAQDCPGHFISSMGDLILPSLLTGFLNLGATDILGQGGGGCPMHSGLFGRIDGLQLLDTSGTSYSGCDNQKYFQVLPRVPQGGKISPYGEPLEQDRAKSSPHHHSFPKFPLERALGTPSIKKHLSRKPWVPSCHFITGQGTEYLQ